MAPTNSRLCGMAALLLGAMIFGNFQLAEAQCGGFKATCSRYAVYGSGAFVAYCDSDSPETYSPIDLSQFISNDGGNLAVGRDFQETCGELKISEDTEDSVNLFATCKPSDPTAPGHVTSFNLNDHISVASNFGLVWNNCRR